MGDDEKRERRRKILDTENPYEDKGRPSLEQAERRRRIVETENPYAQEGGGQSRSQKIRQTPNPYADEGRAGGGKAGLLDERSARISATGNPYEKAYYVESRSEMRNPFGGQRGNGTWFGVVGLTKEQASEVRDLDQRMGSEKDPNRRKELSDRRDTILGSGDRRRIFVSQARGRGFDPQRGQVLPESVVEPHLPKQEQGRKEAARR